MNAKQKLHQVKLQEWASKFTAQRDSGLSVKTWCAQNGISIHAYNYWKHLLKEEVVDQLLPEIVPISVTTPVINQPLEADSRPDTATFSSDTNSQANSLRANCTNRADHVPVRLTINDVTIETDSSVPETFLLSLIKVIRYA